MAQPMQSAGEENYATNMVGLVTEIARALVDSPEIVSVETIEEGDGTILRLRVASTDIGKVIGKQGRIANALRTVVKSVAMKDKKKVYVEIIA